MFVVSVCSRFKSILWSNYLAALWRPFPKEVLQNLKVPAVLLDDQKRLKTMEERTLDKHRHTINALLESTQAIHKYVMPHATFNDGQFTTTLRTIDQHCTAPTPQQQNNPQQNPKSKTNSLPTLQQSFILQRQVPSSR